MLTQKDTSVIRFSPTRADPQKASFSTLGPDLPSGTEVAHRVVKTTTER